MTLDTSLLAWVALAIAISLTPGPDVLLVAGHAARRGLRAGLAAGAGVTLGGLWYMALCGFGLLSLLNLSPILFLVVKSVGAIYLAWLGIRMVRGALQPTPVVVEDAPVAVGAPFVQGLLSNVLNPKVALFYLAVLPQFVGSGAQAPLHGAALIAIHYAINMPWIAAVAFGAARAGRHLRQGTLVRWVEGALGATFVTLAGSLAVSRI
jgi:threonine/homoserine/homoserine lactone efflux protein